MTTKTNKKRIVKYLNRDFESLKKDLVEHLRVYFGDTVEDFNESSVGMMLAEMCCFVGDNFNYYIDKKFDESFYDTAKEKKNIFKHAKQLGYKPFGKTAATGEVDAFVEVPSRRVNEKIEPDMRYARNRKKRCKTQK